MPVSIDGPSSVLRSHSSLHQVSGNDVPASLNMSVREPFATELSYDMAHGLFIGLLCCAALCRAQTSAAGDPPYIFGVTVVDTTGLEGRIYYIKRDSQKLPDFSKMKAKGSIYTSELNVPLQHWRVGFPGVTKRFEWFAIDYHGRLWIGRPGDYRFALASDDGAKLYIDDQVVIDNDGCMASHG